MAEKAKDTKSRQTRKNTEQRLEEAGPELYDRVQQRAYQIWEAEGRPGGREAEHWQQAEREVRQEQAGAPTRRAAKEDTSGAVAAPKKAGKPGASAELGGTPGAPATSSSGRQASSSRRKPGRSSS